MGLLDKLFGTDRARKDLYATSQQAQGAIDQGQAAAEAALRAGRTTGRADLNQGFDQAIAQLTGAQPGIEASINQGYDQGRTDLTQGYAGAEGAMQPWVDSGRGAQDRLDAALGVKGAEAAKGFYDDYGGNDPFRAYRDELANKQIQQQFAGTGRTGAMGLAVGRASLERGSSDLNAYLDRLTNAGARGQQASGQVAGYRAQAGESLANNATGRGSALAQLGTQFATNKAQMGAARGTALAGLETGSGSELANLSFGAGQQRAANTINLGNAVAGTRTQPMNNLINLAGTGLRAFSTFR